MINFSSKVFRKMIILPKIIYSSTENFKITVTMLLFGTIELSFIFVISSIFLIVFILFMRSKSLPISSFVGKRRVLLIIAHPDDECMFFAPTVLSLTANWSSHFVLLCLSEGEIICACAANLKFPCRD